MTLNLLSSASLCLAAFLFLSYSQKKHCTTAFRWRYRLLGFALLGACITLLCLIYGTSMGIGLGLMAIGPCAFLVVMQKSYFPNASLALALGFSAAGGALGWLPKFVFL